MNASRRFRSPVQLKPASATRMHAEQHDLGYHYARQAFRQLTPQAYWGAIGVPAKQSEGLPRGCSSLRTEHPAAEQASSNVVVRGNTTRSRADSLGHPIDVVCASLQG